MTSSVDIAVIGGGVIGLSCARQLAREGLRVRVYERGLCGGGATQASLGVLAPPSPLPQHPLQVMHRRSLAQFGAFAAALAAESGIDCRYRQCGSLEILPSESQYAMAHKESAFVASNPGIGLPALQLIPPDEVRALEPRVTATEFGALWCPSAANVSVAALIAALTGAVRHAGVEICEGWEVTGIETEAGKVTGVRAGREFTACGLVLAAAGVWTGGLMPVLQEYAPTRPVRGQALLLRTSPQPVAHIVKWQRGYIMPWESDCTAIGSTTERGSGFDSSVTAGGQHEILGKALTAAPCLAGATISKSWAGLRPAPLDRRPIMGALPGVEGLYAAAGHYKIGFGFAPICAELVAAAVLTGRMPDEGRPFLPRRPAEGDSSKGT